MRIHQLEPIFKPIIPVSITLRRRHSLHRLFFLRYLPLVLIKHELEALNVRHITCWPSIPCGDAISPNLVLYIGVPALQLSSTIRFNTLRGYCPPPYPLPLDRRVSNLRELSQPLLRHQRSPPLLLKVHLYQRRRHLKVKWTSFPAE